jgi:hypothetical protein
MAAAAVAAAIDPLNELGAMTMIGDRRGIRRDMMV